MQGGTALSATTGAEHFGTTIKGSALAVASGVLTLSLNMGVTLHSLPCVRFRICTCEILMIPYLPHRVVVGITGKQTIVFSSVPCESSST